MSRKGTAEKRRVAADPIYNSKLVTKTINKIMYDGKKSLAENIFYSAMDVIEDQTGESPLEVYKEALNNIMPVLEIKSRRVGGANYQVPVEVSNDRRLTLGLRWIIESSRERGERGMVSKLANEIIDAYNGEGGAVRKKEEVHRMAEANKAFAHYKW
ncbi:MULTISPECIES: 30S ribosomal protein S7 [unclassified Candidatus Frackibacter]|uniref:30S ribosomal protein S7 n=1 Tax=unclassified Candidatus Frackibacter TaxID=2648818 RepID=UPI00088C3C21|nr:MULTISPECIES: 30S ribosomal protein S7 [unclassified Candidatus Frackibacter]SDC21896.1 SSU ribosomal protein S7P [Candidatus Frackibacter sp. WG11]SEM49959.1 SSU ribosomal protein S7P [Candidatus Frackibacter sp. WG12]SFL51427.1 SSU ribosomal protein S7P [Candidatus Frackibacter sp. WG13]